jgi:hypothetical protein
MQKIPRKRTHVVIDARDKGAMTAKTPTGQVLPLGLESARVPVANMRHN